jgi:hypothetical protein
VNNLFRILTFSRNVASLFKWGCLATKNNSKCIRDYQRDGVGITVFWERD